MPSEEERGKQMIGEASTHVIAGGEWSWSANWFLRQFRCHLELVIAQVLHGGRAQLYGLVHGEVRVTYIIPECT